ncbi:hypothetical protein CP533_0158 [Ophiocordyceps camponoti-saundersi (nom. inval.)]|nr:hypothetical protein CP533_0158 [Ophiocordyceps camponoti-saundersi (nom. inval.)]
MKLSLLPYFAILAFSGLIQAAPNSVTEDKLFDVLDAENKTAVFEKRAEASSASPMLFKRANKCGSSSFENQGSEASPNIDDCKRIVWNIRRGGRWTLFNSNHRQLAQYGTCAFGAQTDYPFKYVGNEDIMDLINDSIKYFARHDGKVGSKGKMDCSGGIFGGEVHWGLYHT